MYTTVRVLAGGVKGYEFLLVLGGGNLKNNYLMAYSNWRAEMWMNEEVELGSVCCAGDEVVVLGGCWRSGCELCMVRWGGGM